MTSGKGSHHVEEPTERALGNRGVNEGLEHGCCGETPLFLAMNNHLHSIYTPDDRENIIFRICRISSWFHRIGRQLQESGFEAPRPQGPRSACRIKRRDEKSNAQRCQREIHHSVRTLIRVPAVDWENISRDDEDFGEVTQVSPRLLVVP